jgi:polysaccharide pyruvyl transferase WcaK-like protein
MFRLSVLAALLRVKLVYLSVGVGPIETSAGRWLLKRALESAQYRSYRDQDSKLYMQGVGFNTSADPVAPDLVFGLARGQLDVQVSRAQQRKPIVGLGLKDYSSDQAGTNSYRDYVATMARFIVWLGAQGYTVRLLIGDAQYDEQVRSDLVNELRRGDTGAECPLVLIDPVPTVAELLRQLAESEFVISPRFHNLVLALMLNKPILGLSDLRKIDVLLSDMGLPQYCLSLASLDHGTLIQRFTELQKDSERLKISIGEKVGRLREAVDRQYAAVFDGAMLASKSS